MAMPNPAARLTRTDRLAPLQVTVKIQTDRSWSDPLPWITTKTCLTGVFE